MATALHPGAGARMEKLWRMQDRLRGLRRWRDSSLEHLAKRSPLIPGVICAALLVGTSGIADGYVRGLLAEQEAPYYHERVFLPSMAAFLAALFVCPLG